MRFKVTTLVKLSGNFSLKKSSVPETCLSVLLPHLRKSLWMFFFCYSLAHETGRNMEMSHSLVEVVFACLHALPVHVGTDSRRDVLGKSH